MEYLPLQLPPPPDTQDNTEWVEKCLALIDQQTDALGAMRAFFVQMQGPQAPAPSSVPAAPTASTRNKAAAGAAGDIPADIDLSGLVVDLEGAQTTLEKVVKIGETIPEDRLLNTTQISKFLLRSGTTTAKLQSIRVAVQRALEGNPSLFELVRRATYKYTGGVPSTDPDLNAPDPDAQEQ